MAKFKVGNVAIKGISSCVPSKELSNHNYEYLTEQERKMLIKTTGIEKRRVADDGVTTSDLSYKAAEDLIKSLKWAKEDIDIVVLVTQSQDYFLPATSITLQERLGLSKNCLAFDISLGCSGYVYALSVISSMMSAGYLKKGLLLAGDISTFSLNYKDKSAYPLFGDAGTATALEFNANQSMAFNAGSDGSGYEAIIIPDGGLRNPLNDESFKESEDENGLIRCNRNLHLKGLDIMNFSLREVPANIKGLSEFADTPIDNMDYFVLHQANKLINNSIRKKLKQDESKFPLSLNTYGNTSSASIPLTICAELKGQIEKVPKKILMSGFGVGLSWASALINSETIESLNIIDY